jgi:predicted nucleotidyltransferase
VVLPALPAAAVTYEELVELARADPNVLGLVLTGSRASGLGVSDESDWDVRLVVRDDVVREYRTRLGTPHGSRVEVVVFSLSDFEQEGEPGTPTAWDRPSYVHGEVVVDKGGIAELVDRKRTLPLEIARRLAAERLDDYVNSYFRSAKSWRLGLALEARLDAAESIPPLLELLFALQGRVRPFNKHLRAEPPPGVESLPSRLDAILATGDLGEQQRLFRDVETLARAHGLGDVIDGWEPDVSWLRGG